MAQVFLNPDTHFTFNFTKKKVRQTSERNGYKGIEVVDKYSIAYLLDHIKYRYYVVGIMDVNTYDELKGQLLKDLEVLNYKNVTIIK